MKVMTLWPFTPLTDVFCIVSLFFALLLLICPLHTIICFFLVRAVLSLGTEKSLLIGLWHRLSQSMVLQIEGPLAATFNFS